MREGLAVGHTSFAGAFGDRLYCRARKKDKYYDELECPFCGRWAVVGYYVGNLEYIDHDCPNGDQLECAKANEDWYTVSTKELLSMHAPRPERFFFPRAWNSNKPWISYEDLEQKFEAYLKEKQNV